MTMGTKKPIIQIGWGIVLVGVVALLCWAGGSVLIWLYDTFGIWIGARND